MMDIICGSFAGVERTNKVPVLVLLADKAEAIKQVGSDSQPNCTEAAPYDNKEAPIWWLNVLLSSLNHPRWLRNRGF